MNRRQLLTVTGLSMIAQAVRADDKPQAGKEKLSKQWLKQVHPHFVMAYHFDKADLQDLRPPIHDNGSFQGIDQPQEPPYSLLGAGEHLDVAALIARVQKRVSVSLTQFKDIIGPIFDGTEFTNVSECYDPHHIIVTYDELGGPTGAIEICFSCQNIRIFPGGRDIRNDCHDLRPAAHLLFELGLPLCEKYPSLKEYDTDWTRRQAAMKKLLKK